MAGPGIPTRSLGSAAIPVVLGLILCGFLIAGLTKATAQSAIREGDSRCLSCCTDCLPRCTYLPLVMRGPGGPSALPDLMVDYVYLRMRGYRGGCVNKYDDLMLVPCIRNRGAAAAGSFGLTVNGTDGSRLAGLQAGASTCVETVKWSGWHKEATVLVDPTNEVAESDETNNMWLGNVAIPTPPLICTPTSTPSHTPTATPTPTLLHAGLVIAIRSPSPPAPSSVHAFAWRTDGVSFGSYQGNKWPADPASELQSGTCSDSEIGTVWAMADSRCQPVRADVMSRSAHARAARPGYR